MRSWLTLLAPYQRGSEGWVAWESGGERIMHPVATDDPYFDRLAEWFTRRGVERPEQVFFEVADAMNHEAGRLRARLREDAEGNGSASFDADPVNRLTGALTTPEVWPDPTAAHGRDHRASLTRRQPSRVSVALG
jgi:hypothetical protein